VWPAALRPAIVSAVQVAGEGIESGTASLEGVREGARERGMVWSWSYSFTLHALPGLFQHSRWPAVQYSSGTGFMLLWYCMSSSDHSEVKMVHGTVWSGSVGVYYLQDVLCMFWRLI
jgi:hypothetical protein